MSLENPKLSEKQEDFIGPFRKEVSGLKVGIENNVNFVNKLSTGIPKGISVERSKKTLMNINFSNTKVSNIVEQIPEQKKFGILFEAAQLKQNYKGLSDEQAIQYVVSGENESDFDLKFLEHEDFETYHVLKAVYNTIDNGGDPFSGIRIPDNVIFGNEDIISSIDADNRSLFFDKLPKDKQEKILSGIEKRYKALFKRSFFKSLRDNPGKSPISLFDNDEIFGLFLKYYSVQLLRQGKNPINVKSLSDQDKFDIKERFKAEIFELGYEVSDVDEDILREIRERDRLIREENQRRLEEWMKRNRTINGPISAESSDNNLDNNNITKIESYDTNSASGEEIAKKQGLGKALKDQYENNNIPEDPAIDEEAFPLARERFIKSHVDLQSSLNIDVMKNLYDNKNNSIKNLEDKSRNGLKKLFQDHPDEITKIYNLLLLFPKEINNTKEELSNNSKFIQSAKDVDKNDHALGILIDNVRNIFSKNSKSEKGLKLNDKEPVKLEGDNLIMSGEFNGAEVTIRYNLRSGQIYMNSFLQRSENSKIIIGNTLVANHKVGTLESFDNILADNEALDSQISLLSSIVIDNLEKQSSINSIVIKFMKTFNIINDNQEVKNIEVLKGSDLFKFLEVLGNSDSNTLDHFQSFMEKIMEYSELNWGINNINGTKKDFDKADKNEYESLVAESLESFSKDPTILKGKINFESGSKMGFIKMIIENITDDKANEPNWKLDSSKMTQFIEHLETDGKEA